MAYAIFERTTTRTTSPSVTFMTNGRMALNAATARLFHKMAVENVLMLYDKEAKRVAIRPVGKKDARTFKMTFTRTKAGCSMSGKSFLDFHHIDYSKNRTFPAHWNDNDGLLEIELTNEAVKDAQQRKLLPVEHGKRQSKVS